jgi:hypothetical protein
MSARSKLTAVLMAGLLCLPLAAQPDTQAAKPDTQAAKPDTPAAHRAHKAKKPRPLPPPLPSGTQGPVPQVPLDAIPAVAPTVSYQDGMLTIVAPNSTLGDILRGVRKRTSADIDIPANANERVATHLGPGPARQIVAELLNGSRFNYILLGSPQNSNLLVRVVLVAKTGPDNPTPPALPATNAAGQPNAGNPEAEAPEEPAEETPDQSAADADQQPPPGDQPGVKTPQQLLQEMQQRQLQMQQGQQGQPAQPPSYPPPGGAPQPPPQ